MRSQGCGLYYNHKAQPKLLKMDIALITGASAGIGKALAKECAKDGRNLMLIGRDETRLQAVGDELQDEYGVKAHCLAMDLATAEAPQELANAVRDKGYTVRMLINNAAAFNTNTFANTDQADIEQMLQLNMVSLTLCTKLFLDDMLKANQGFILNVASMACFQAIPNMACYAASKAYVLSFTEALATELKHTGVKVSVLCPGLTDTDMAHETMAKLPPKLGNLTELMLMSTTSVARAGYLACIEGRTLEVPGAVNKAAALFSQTQPRWLMRGLAGGASRWLSGQS